jgi:hypothetical protein
VPVVGEVGGRVHRNWVWVDLLEGEEVPVVGEVGEVGERDHLEDGPMLVLGDFREYLHRT